MKPLSLRQTQIYDLLVAGMTATQIGAKLEIAVGTVRTHVEKVYEKLGIKARRELLQVKVDAADLTSNLTHRQAQVLKGFVAGKSLPEIAKDMGISLRTVECHRYMLYKRMNVDTRLQLLAVARHQVGA